VEGTHHKHRKLSAFTLLASICFALRPAEVHKRVLNTLIALIITFGRTSHGKMPLESHFEEARAFLAAVVISALDMPEHWYAPMLPADHPSSFCKLSGLTTEELNLVMEASGFVVKRGKNSMRRDVVMQSSSTVMLIACHARRPFAACAGGRTDVCGPEHSFLY
jgi:hypothetical protein